MSLDLHFPTIILHEHINDHESINEDIKSKIGEIKKTVDSGGDGWIGRPYNTCGTWDISKDKNFETITNIVTDYANNYCSQLVVDTGVHPVKCEEGWLNIYNENDFQEYHNHAGFKLSAVYYVDVSEEGRIYFESPFIDNNPLKIRLLGPITDTRADYNVSTGDVIVFRGYLRHCVPPVTKGSTRITLAYNFN